MSAVPVCAFLVSCGMVGVFNSTHTRHDKGTTMSTIDSGGFDWESGEHLGPPPPPPPLDDLPAADVSHSGPSDRPMPPAEPEAGECTGRAPALPAPTTASTTTTASAAAGDMGRAPALPADILEMVDRAIVYAGGHSGKVMVLCRHVKGSSWSDKPLEELIPVVEYWHSRLPDTWKRGDMRYVEDVVTRFYEAYPETKYGIGRDTKAEVVERAADMLERGDLPSVARRFQDPIKQAIATLCWVWQRTVWEQNGRGGDVPFGLGAKDLTEFVYRKELAKITDPEKRTEFIDERKDALWNILSKTFTKPPYDIVQMVAKGDKWAKGIKSKSTTWIMPCAIPGLGEST